MDNENVIEELRKLQSGLKFLTYAIWALAQLPRS
jgi:hypothetical protein